MNKPLTAAILTALCSAASAQTFTCSGPCKVTITPIVAPAPTPTPTPTPTPAPAPAPVAGRVFADNSPWYQPLPADVPLDPNSAAMALNLVKQVATYYGPNAAINTEKYTAPVYFAPPGTPTVRIRQHNCQNKSNFPESGLENQFLAVPLLPWMRQSAGGDREMVIVSPSTNEIWEMWQFRRTLDGVALVHDDPRNTDPRAVPELCWGGRIVNARSNIGAFPRPYGTLATGLSFLGGQITAEELQAGEINHAMDLALVEVRMWNDFSWPANRSDGPGTVTPPDRIREGQRIRLNPSINVDALPLTRVGKIVAKAAQKYGFIITDKSGAVSLRMRNVQSYTVLGKPNPYPALFEGLPGYKVLAGFPWKDMQVVAKDYGKP